MKKETFENKRNIKDSVFHAIFQDKENVLTLVKDLHPELDVTLDDVKILYTSDVFRKGVVSDLGILVQDKFILIVEAQTEWNDNVIARCAIYIIKQILAFFDADKRKELHSSKKVTFPCPEVYIVYPGDKKIPEEISLADYFYLGPTPFFNVTAKVITEADKKGILHNYLYICKQLKENTAKYETQREIVLATIDECIANNVLPKFLLTHREEITLNMEALFTQEMADQALVEEGIAIGEIQGIAIGEAQGIAIGEAQGIEKSIKKLYQKGHSVASLAEDFDKTQEEIREILEL